MTISTTASTTTLLGNGVTTQFVFSFIYNSAGDIQVIYTDTNGTQTVLTTAQYNLFLNAAQPGSIWGIGGIVTYPTSGPAIPNGSSITITRTVPLTQDTSISNQGDFSPQVIEAALDTLCQEIQQVSARTGQLRGVWATNVQYNYGDIVVDGANGNNTGNYYMCIIANTSTVWATNLASGDWTLVLNVQAISGAAGGDLSGSYPNPTVAKINGSSLGSTSPTAGNILIGSGTQWVTATVSGDVTLSNAGVVTIANNSVTPEKINSSAVTTTKIADSNVTLAKISNASANSKILGSNATGSGVSYSELTLGPNLSISGSIINSSGGVFTHSFNSSAQTITSAGTLTLAHGLGSIPKFVTTFLTCTTNDSNFTAGKILCLYNISSAVGASSQGAAIVVDATNLTLQFSSNSSVYSVPNFSGGTNANLTNTSWTASFSAYS